LSSVFIAINPKSSLSESKLFYSFILPARKGKINKNRILRWSDKKTMDFQAVMSDNQDMGGREPRYLTTSEVARLCSVKADTVLKWIKKGRLEAVRTAGGHHRIDPRKIECLTEAGLPPDCIPQPLRCWEYLSDSGELREACRKCVVYQVRAAWCFQVLGLEHDVGHSKQFCTTSCSECVYYRRVRGFRTNVLIITSDENLVRCLAEQTNESVAISFARNPYEASALINTFRPAFVVVDEELAAGRAGLLDSLASDARVPGLKVILAIRSLRTARSNQPGMQRIAGVIVKPFTLERIAAVIHRLPVESQ
jgi:excisionase family DNA binding protein